MSELALTLIRFGFLALLWLFVLVTINVLRRDLQAPADTPLSLMPNKPQRRPRTKRVRARNLVVTEGSLAGTVIPLGTIPVTIGRAPENTLVVTDDYASSHHARISQSDGRWIVEDIGSTNGTWVNRNRIVGPTVLEPGSTLRIGRTVLELRK
jgi:pSer/pThr/pTyr-binding forkhead associated (FHA) protein